MLYALFQVIVELRKQVTGLTTQLSDVKKELAANCKKAVATLTTERDALKAKKTAAPASSTGVKELTKLSVATIEASAREKLLLQQIDRKRWSGSHLVFSQCYS